MNKLILTIAAALLIGLSAQAQRYARVNDSLVPVTSIDYTHTEGTGYEYSSGKYKGYKSHNGMERAGKILTFAGIGAMTAGTIAYTASLTNISSSDMGGVYAGVGLMVLGAGLATAGVPIWIVGANKKRSYSLAFTPDGVGVKMKF